MECNNCGNDHALVWRLFHDKERGWVESCDICGRLSSGSAYIPDVYWTGPGYHPGIVDKNNKPIYLESRRHKAALMREQNTREAGDLHHGQRGTEFAHARTPDVRTPNDNVLKLKKMFHDHDMRRNNGR